MMKQAAKPPLASIVNAFRSSESRLRAFVRRLVVNDSDVDDICQETVLRALEAEKQRTIDSPEAFLFGVARNVVRKQLTKQSRSVIDLVDGLAPDEYAAEEPSLDRVLDERQRLELFTEAVATLPPQCQRVFVMKRVYGYSQRDIAARLKISESTVEKHVAAGLKRCKDEMEQHAHEPRRHSRLSK